MKRLLILFLFLFLLPLALVACGDSSETATQDGARQSVDKPASEATATEAERRAAAVAELHEIFDAYFEIQLERSPIFASSIGDDRYNDRFTVSIDPGFMAEGLEIDKEYLARVLAIDESLLEGQDLLSYRIFVRDLEREIEGAEFPSHLIPLNQFYSTPNFFAQLGSGGSVHPFDTVKDYEDFLSRVDGFVQWTDQAIANMNEGIEKGVVQPKLLMERTVPQIEAHIVENAEDSLFWKPVANMPESFSAEDRERLEAAYRKTINERIVPAYVKLRDYVAETYMPAARDTHGMWDLPNGEAWYAWLVEGTTTTDLTPAAIHQIGLDEVERIHSEMRKVMEQVEFEGTLDDFFEFMNNDPQFIADSREELLQHYEDLRPVIDPELPKLFDVMPKAEYEIRAVEPFREKSASSASYRTGTPDGSRPGVFYVNTYDLSARPTWTVESLFLHEAAPGHHFQLSIQQELEGLPKFRRFGGYTAFIEGWGLYAETLGEELGVYADPYQYFGKLNAELWRAIRLVVDTGLHYKGWSRDDVLDFMYENSAVKEARAVSEAERYMAIPSQALAYKIGQLKISGLREKAEEALGDDFDIREFHNQVLLDGALPLSVLEGKIDRWIESKR